VLPTVDHMISDDEIKDCVWRHEHFLALKLEEHKVKHRPGCTRGKRRWLFSWRWPFVHTWISQSICMCEIIAMDEMIATFDQLKPVLEQMGFSVTQNVIEDMKDMARENLPLMAREKRTQAESALAQIITKRGRRL
jgi:hypothetical protein